MTIPNFTPKVTPRPTKHKTDPRLKAKVLIQTMEEELCLYEAGKLTAEGFVNRQISAVRWYNDKTK